MDKDAPIDRTADTLGTAFDRAVAAPQGRAAYATTSQTFEQLRLWGVK